MALKKKSSKGGGFVYKPRSAEEYEARKSIANTREGFLVDGVKVFSPKAGSHTVRILPPTWPKAKHYGYDVYVHFDIGPDGGAYLCLAKMQGGECDICNERKRAAAEGEEELMKALSWTRRVATWIIDRDNEKEGPEVWCMPQTFDRDLTKVCIDKKTGEVLNPDDPENGFDAWFDREGEKMKTKYIGIQLDRRTSPLSDDEEQMQEWLDFIEANPIPEQLVFQDEEYIAELVGSGLTWADSARNKASGSKKKKAADDDDDEEFETPKRPRVARKEVDEDDEAIGKMAARKKKAADDDEEDEEEEEEAPRKAAKKKPVVKGKAKAAADDDEDEEEETEDEEDEEEAPRKAVKKSAKRKAADDDEEDEETEEEAEDEEEEEAPRKAAKKSTRKAANGDDDEDDEPAAKPAKKRPALGSRLAEMKKKHARKSADD